jgi:hypothetical protein
MRLQVVKYLVEPTGVVVDKRIPSARYNRHLRQGPQSSADVGYAQLVGEKTWAQEAGDREQGVASQDAQHGWNEDGRIPLLATVLRGRHGLEMWSLIRAVFHTILFPVSF